MSLSNTCKGVIASVSAVAVAVIVPVSALFIKGLNKNVCQNVDTRTTIVAMAPITAPSSVQPVFVVPPSKDAHVAALYAYSMWEKTNGHFGRTINTLIPIYADGHLAKFAVQGYYDNFRYYDNFQSSCTRYDFWWRGQSKATDIYLQNVSYNSADLVKPVDSPIKGTIIQRLCREKILGECYTAQHPLTEKFNLEEIYGVSRLSDLNTQNIDWALYDPGYSSDKYRGCK